MGQWPLSHIHMILDTVSMALLGYARTSTDRQTTALQLDALNAAGCIRIWEDTGLSGSTTSRPQLGRV
ncbi:recombinase family protein [Quadrisphaera oryzae]|uniref:recombinase family protein n=1 Tax=Quadrisphaera oryzae TaxID=2509661 RepID=UPI004043E322